MKSMKKILAFFLTLSMVLSMAVPVMAEGSDGYEIFIKNDAKNHVYDAYQIFSGDLSSDGTTLSNVQWGQSVKDGSALVAALLADTKTIETTTGTTTLASIFSKLSTTDVDKQATVAAEILGTVSNDSTTLDRFAEVVGKVTTTADGNVVHDFLEKAWTSGVQSEKTIAVTEGDTTVDKVFKGYYIKNLPAGYYLIKDRDTTVEDKADFYTKYIIRVVKSADIDVKGEGAGVTKTVNDTLGGTYESTEDANTNDVVYFKWEGELPDNLDSYDSYNYKFIDKMDPGLTFIQYEQIYIENSNGTVAEMIYDVAEANPVNQANDLKDKGINITGPVAEPAEGTPEYYEFSLEFENLMSTYSSILPSQKVIVKYSAYLNRTADINGANVNEVILEYDNNPNGEGTGQTVPSKAYVFTFHIQIDKYDAANSAKKLEGVEFLLYEQDGEGSTITKHYAKVVTEEMVADGVEINGKAVSAADVGLVYGFTTVREEASVLDTDANGAITLKGLDRGLYYLEETKTNDGYNLLDTPVQVEITPNYEINEQKVVSASPTYKVDGRDQGSSSVVGVRNSKGSTLPSTGGIGTTIFYIAGGFLFIAAAVLLITKKRMSVKK